MAAGVRYSTVGSLSVFAMAAFVFYSLCFCTGRPHDLISYHHKNANGSSLPSIPAEEHFQTEILLVSRASRARSGAWGAARGSGRGRSRR